MGQGRGYDGFAMSVNARIAYEQGELPAGKICQRRFFKKHHILAADIAQCCCGTGHHTSSHFNETAFYTSGEIAESLRDIVNCAKRRRESEAESKGKRYQASVKWIEWSGTRRHPVATEKTCTAVVERRGSFWLISPINGSKPFRKKDGANGFELKIL